MHHCRRVVRYCQCRVSRKQFEFLQARYQFESAGEAALLHQQLLVGSGFLYSNSDTSVTPWISICIINAKDIPNIFLVYIRRNWWR